MKRQTTGTSRMTCRLTPTSVLLLLLIAVASMHAQGVEPGLRDFLEPAAPDPFGAFSGGATTLAFTLAQDGPVRLRVFDFFYGPVATLVDEVRPAGRVVLPFVPSGFLSSGMYLIELRTERGVQQRRMLYLR